jgi:F420-non-reducing hydrogenase iron-sulfur subunit
MEAVKIHLFCCSTTFDPDEFIRRDTGNRLKVIPMPCSGKIDILYLTKAFETGADGVAVVTCKQGECRYLEGNLRAQKRAEAVDSLLDESGLGRGRVAIIQMGDKGLDQVLLELDDFCNGIKAAPKAATRSELGSGSRK